MKTDVPAPPPIPIPLQQRWRDARLRLVPLVVFAAALGTIAFLWKDHVASPTMVGQAEPVLANVSSHKAGVLAELSVNRFQRVKMGDPIGQVMVADPKLLASSLAVIHAEIDMLRAEMKPVLAHQRKAMDYDQLRLDWMRERASLASARINLQAAETEYKRMAELVQEKIVSQRTFEKAQAGRDKLQSEVDELARLVAEAEKNLQELQISNTLDAATVTLDPLHAAIAVEESKLRLTEAELSPVTLRAPIDGIVSTIYQRSGEAVLAGKPIVAIATLHPVRIVGYLRPPINDEPKVGMRVEVRTRGMRREVGTAKIMEVGTQMETVPVTLVGSSKLASAELGLPIDISLPDNLRIRPGELVDIILTAKVD